MINHSAGSLTSQAYHKRWVIKNELLADAAEKASVAAHWMGGHFHDTAAGTATPRAYEFAWNDDIIALNQFADVLTDASGAVISGINTQTKGIPVAVYDALNIAREDLLATPLIGKLYRPI